MILQPGPAILPVSHGSAILTSFYSQVMAVAAANMLSATRLGLSGLDLTNGVLLLDFRMAEDAPRTVPPEWNLVY